MSTSRGPNAMNGENARRRSAPLVPARGTLAPSSPLPSLVEAIDTPLERLVPFIESLAQPSSYTLQLEGVRALLKLAIYSFAIRPDSSLRPVFFPSLETHELMLALALAKDEVTLSSIQRAAAAPSLRRDGEVPSTTGTETTSSLAPEYTESRRGKICGHVFKGGESVYRCRDCAVDATCVLCAKCFHGSSHARQGHDVTMTIHGGVGAGCCDCGDIEAFKEGCHDDCKYHSLRTAPQGSAAAASPETDEQIARAIQEVERVLIVLVEWMIQILDRSPSEFVPPKTVDDIIAQLPQPTESTTSSTDGADSSEEVANRLLSSHHDPRMMFSSGSPSVASIRLASLSQPYFPFGVSRPPPSASSSTASDVFAPTSPPTYVSSTSRGKARATSPAPSTAAISGSSTSEAEGATATPAGPWSVVLWNDEKHSFDQVIDQVNQATGMSRKRAGAIAQEVDTHGRAIIDISHDPSRLVLVARVISRIKLAVTVRLSSETFLEQVAGELVNVLRDLANVDVAGRGGLLTETVAKVLLGSYAGTETSRFQKLVQSDVKLWKEARKRLAELYVVLLGVSPTIKLDLSVQFAQTYSPVAEAYLLADREPENSIIFFGVQVFTAPSVAATLTANHSFLSHLISILYSFFTEQLDPTSNRCRLALPPNLAIKRLDLASSLIEQKRYFQIFSEMNHVIQSPAVRRLICAAPQLIDYLATFLDLFTSMNLNTRAVDTHVEYESDTWVTAFNVTIQLGKLARAFGEAFEHASPLQLAQALTTVLGRMAHIAMFETIEWAGQSFQVPQFDVANSAVSFHHPLAWLFAELCKHGELLSARNLQQIGVENLGQLVARVQGHLVFLNSMDQPLRVIVLVAQIRAGLWVRNGFGIRAQQLHYKEYSLRENTYDQDVFFLQTALVVLDPAHVLAALLARFDVHHWLAQPDLADVAHPTYEPAQAMLMTEELLYLIIVLLSDPTHIVGCTSEEVLRRELIHNLCLGPTTFSDLTRRTSEKFADDPTFERVLGEVATFKSPVSTSDQGTYSLKPQFFADVNPYFPRFSRNQREEADKIVREHLKKQQGGGSDDPVIVPKKLEISDGPFVDLFKTFESEALYPIIFHALRTGRARGESLFSEVLVDEGLHLVMLALAERPAAIVAFALKPQLAATNEDSPWKNETTLVNVLVKIEEDERIKSVRPKAKWCLDRLTEYLGDAVNNLRSVGDDSASVAKAALEKKRLAAKARQAAILKKFQQQQASFLASAENIDDEESVAQDGDDRMAVEGEAELAKVSLGACIVCQDELDELQAFGTLALVQISNLIRQTPVDVDYQHEVLQTPLNLDRDASHVRPFGIASKRIGVNPDDESGDGLSLAWPRDTVLGLHASACGHMMHFVCFETYCKSIEARHLGQPTRCHPENTHRREFICPLCKSLGNVLLPTTIDSEQRIVVKDPSDLGAWAQSTHDIVKGHGSSDQISPHSRLTFDDVQEGMRPLQIHTPEGLRLGPWKTLGRLPLRAQDTTPELRMVNHLLASVDPLAREVFQKHTRSWLPNDVLRYTVESIEIAARGQASEEKLDGVAVNEATGRMLRSMLHSLRLLVHTKVLYREVPRFDKDDLLEIAQYAVFSHLGGAFAPDLPDTDSRLSLLSFDPLTTIIEVAAVAPHAFHHVVAFAFYTELVQNYVRIILYLASSGSTLVVLREDGEEQGSDEGIPSASSKHEFRTLALIRKFFVSSSAQGINGEDRVLTLGRYLYSYTLPFLRQASILYRTIVGAAASPPSGDDSTSQRSEFARLLAMLQIPDPTEALQHDYASSSLTIQAMHVHLHALRSMIPGWSQIATTLPPGSIDPTSGLPHIFPTSAFSPIPRLRHPAIYELVGLPRQLDTLVAASLASTCSTCGLVPEHPALCLFCGLFVCSQSFCCMDSDDEAQHGECNTHMWTCGGSVGIYYMVKRNMLLYLYTDKGSFATPPYLDSHGEVDLGGRRGRNQFPQFLHEGRYDEVRKLWLNHGIPTVVARKLDGTTDNGGWETL